MKGVRITEGEEVVRDRDEYDERTRCEKRVTVWPSVLYFMYMCRCGIIWKE